MKGSHLNNTSQGASTEKVNDFDNQILGQLVDFLKRHEMRSAGFDLVESGGKWLAFEYNIQPRIFSGTFTDEKSDFLSKTIK